MASMQIKSQIVNPINIDKYKQFKKKTEEK